MIQKLGSLWVDLDAVVAVRDNDRDKCVTLYLADGRGIVLEHAEREEFLTALVAELDSYAYTAPPPEVTP